MAVPIFITILAYLHVIAAMGWLGGAVLFVSVIAPGLRSLSPQASLEFLAKIGPKATRFFAGSATATIIFGLGLLSQFPAFLSSNLVVGTVLGLLAYVTAIMTMRYFTRADKLAKEKLASGQPGPPPPELTKALRSGGITVTLTVLLLVVALMFMVYSGFPF